MYLLLGHQRELNVTQGSCVTLKEKESVDTKGII